MLETGAETMSTDDLVGSLMAETSHTKKVAECSDAVSAFLTQLWDGTGGYGSVQWDSTADDDKLVQVLVQVAQWVVRCRGRVVRWDGIDKSDKQPDRVEVDAPPRLAATLYNIARGHAIACGRRRLEREDIQFAVRVGLDSMPDERRRVIRALALSERGVISIAEAQEAQGTSRPTVSKDAKVLESLGAVDRLVKAGEGSASIDSTIRLPETEKWLLDERWVLARVPQP